MAILEDVEIFIESESGDHSVEATKYPVEKGEPYTDHIAKNSSEFTISGYILSDDWETDKDKLINIMNNGVITKYIGKMTAFSVVILRIGESHSSDIQNGMGLEISLRKVRITQTSWQQKKVENKPEQKPPTSGGKKKPVPAKKTATPAKEQYHVVKKGDTYWGMSGKYGTSIAQLRSWNGWEDRKIPVGAKARVK